MAHRYHLDKAHRFLSVRVRLYRLEVPLFKEGKHSM